MKLVCAPCDERMKLVGVTDEAAALTVTFRCARCDRGVALLINGREQKLVRGLGLTIGPHEGDAAEARPAASRDSRSADAACTGAMYQSIYVPFDNSPHALSAADLAITIACHTQAQVTGSHVYAARLHDRRFRQMESGLPERYLEEENLTAQREVHDDLITRGLTLISDSYLDVLGGRCEGRGVRFARAVLEGRNWHELVKDIARSGHDLVVMGALGLGAVEASLVGSVCERVARRIDRDLILVRSGHHDEAAPIVVAIDGSAHAFGALKAALELARIFGKPVEALAVYDPHFHYSAFHGIAGVLSPAAASVFRFREQERLHEEIIDSGLAKLYRAHLDVAASIAAEQATPLKTTLLAGKAFEQILTHVRARKPWLLALGRVGAHADAALDLGSTTENLLRSASCNLLLAARVHRPQSKQLADASVAWTSEAETRLARVPPFARGMARSAVARHALERGHTVVTSDLIDSCLGAMIRSRTGGAEPRKTGDAPAAPATCPYAKRAPAKTR